METNTYLIVFIILVLNLNIIIGQYQIRKLIIKFHYEDISEERKK